MDESLEFNVVGSCLILPKKKRVRKWQVCPGLKSAFLIIPIWLFQNRAISGLFFFTFVLSIQLKAENKISKWMDPNCGSLVSQATALPTEPQPLPNIFVFWTNEHNAVGLNLGVAALKKLFSTFCTNFCSTNDKCQGCRRSRMSRVQPFPGIGSASRRARERKKITCLCEIILFTNSIWHAQTFKSFFELN